jgi:hypothetical protein
MAAQERAKHAARFREYLSESSGESMSPYG